MKTYEEINEMAKMEEVGMRRNAGDQINTAFVHGFKNGEKLGHQEGYQQGLEDGKRQGVAIDGDKRYWDGYHAAQEDGKKIYQKGLDDSWTAARKLCQSEKYGGYEEHCAEIFNRKDMFDVFDYSASEAVEKIREYEEKQKRDCDKEWDSDSEACANSPCHLCRFSPPGSGDGKPCAMCPAEGKEDEKCN